MVSTAFNSILSPWISSDEQKNILSTSSDQWIFARVQKLKEDETGYVTGSKDTVLEWTYLVNRETADFFNPDSVSTVAIKCGIVAFALPFYLVAVMVVDFVKIFVDIGRFFVDIARGESFHKAGYNLLSRVGGDISGLVCAPWYALGMWIASIEGVLFDPMKGRAEAGLIERKWHGVDFYHDLLRKGWHKGGDESVIFLGFCFQKVGNLNDDKRATGAQKFKAVKWGQKLENLSNKYKWDVISHCPCCAPNHLGPEATPA